MTRSCFRVALLSVLVLAACESPNQTPHPVGPETVLDSTPKSEVVASVNGGGRYLLADFLDIHFSVDAEAYADGTASGHFNQRLIFNGELIDFHCEVTCVTVDEANGRAWIGGIVTKNKSKHPDFMGEIHQPGKDVWFRVLDMGKPGKDRTTFLGFEGGGGIITSAEYCEAMIWPDDNARTHPVTSGNITVTP